MKRMRLFALLLALAALLTACGGPAGSEGPGSTCGGAPPWSEPVQSGTAASPDGSRGPEAQSVPPEEPEESAAPADPSLPVYGGSYYDVENVVLYLETYGELPPNYITKAEARDLGWEGGSVEDWLEGAAIGGDRFGNYEGLLPEAAGRTYTECDIDTHGYGSRGSRRLVFSNDGLYFYTSDHYETFREVRIVDGDRVEW